MKALRERAQATFRKLTMGLQPAGSEEASARRIDNNDPGCGIMAVSVERISETAMGPIYSVTHYYEQNGDLMSDPDMTFLDAGSVDDCVYPLTFRQDNIGVNQDAVEWDEGALRIVRFNPRLQTELARFADGWMQNIKEQQRL